MINDGIVKQLRQMGAAEDFVKRTVSTPANDLWMPPTAALLTNHLVDEVATRGLSDSGEKLKEFDPGIGRIAASYVFVRHLAASDPTQYASFDRSLRLALRRKAPETELYGIVQGLANEIEIGRMPYVSDQIAYLIAQRLDQASSQFAKNTPAQCIAILGGNRAALKFRSPESLAALVDVEVSLLDAKLSSQPVNTVDSQNAVRAVVRRAMALDPNEVERLQHPRPNDLEGQCKTLRGLFSIALSSDVSTAAGFLRALRADQS